MQQLRVLQRVREHAHGVELSLPQLVVVGDQSSGKSSLLTRLTGVHFPVNSGTCTKAAIVVQCCHSETHRHDVYELRDPQDGEYHPYALDALPTAITKAQNALLATSGTKIAREEILVRATGPKQMDGQLVDLPGIIHNGDGKEETRELIEKYIKKKETLILLVSEAKDDDEKVLAMELAQKYDPTGSRTLRILTKFDMFDSPEAKDRAVALVNGVDAPILEGVDLGAHAVITAPDGNAANYDASSEAEHLERLGVRARAGIDMLKHRLPEMYAELIRTNLPHLRESVETAKNEAHEGLNRVGDEPADGTMMIKACQDVLLKKLPGLEERLTLALDDLKEGVIQTKENLTVEWSGSKLQPNAFKCPLFQGGDALRECMSDVVKWWRPMLLAFENRVEATMQETVAPTLQSAVNGTDNCFICFVPAHLRECMARQWKSALAEIMRDFRSKCNDILRREVDFGTMDNDLMDTYAAEVAFPDELIEAISIAIASSDLRHAYETKRDDGTEEVATSVLKPILLAEKKAFAEKFNSQSLHKQQQARVLGAVQGLWQVEHMTFLDSILKELRDSVLLKYEDWLKIGLWQSAEIKSKAVEDERASLSRARYKEVLAKMEQCEADLSELS